MTEIYNSRPFNLDQGEALLTVAKVTAPSAAYQYVAPLNSLVITLIDNQTLYPQSITIGDFQYQYLLAANSPLYYYHIRLYDIGPTYVQTCDSSGNVMSTIFDLEGSDYFSTILIIPPGKYAFGPVED